MYVYYPNSKGNWSVGFFSPNGSSNFESEWDKKEEAANRVHWLNGGNNPIPINKLPQRKQRPLSDISRFKALTKDSYFRQIPEKPYFTRRVMNAMGSILLEGTPEPNYWRYIDNLKISDLGRISKKDLLTCRNFGKTSLEGVELICNYFKIELNPIDYKFQMKND